MFRSILPANIAFVAGATGYTGRFVVEGLRKLGIETYAHVRPDSKELARWQDEFGAMGAKVDSTPWEQDAMTARVRAISPTLVFALLGTTKKRAKRAAAAGADRQGESYDAVDYGLTILLLEAVRLAGLQPRFVYLSSVGVSSKPSPSPYLDARRRVEERLSASTVPYTIARPSFIHGTDRDEARPAETLLAKVTDAAVAFAGTLGAAELRERYRSTDGRGLATNLVMVALEPAAENTIIEGSALRRFDPPT
jgi:uncharacterized protein YbjT (DUF2867 family)